MLLAVGGCAGYQVGTRSLYRPDLRTVHVPIFTSDSYRRNLGERLTEAVIKRIETTTTYKVVPLDRADSVLTGRITSDRKRVLAETSNDDPRDLEVGVFVQVAWTDRRGDVLAQTIVPLEADLLEFAQTTRLIPEAGQSLATAQQRAMERMAQQIVGRMEVPW